MPGGSSAPGGSFGTQYAQQTTVLERWLFPWEAAAPASPPASGVGGDSIAQLPADELALERKM